MNDIIKNDFDKWFWSEQDAGTFLNTARYGFDAGYVAGQKAMKAHERKRIKQIIAYRFGDLVSDLTEVMKMIDDD